MLASSGGDDDDDQKYTHVFLFFAILLAYFLITSLFRFLFISSKCENFKVFFFLFIIFAFKSASRFNAFVCAISYHLTRATTNKKEEVEEEL